MKTETSEYIVEYKYIKKLNDFAISLKSKEAGSYEAFHTHYNLLDTNSNIINSPKINEEVANYIIKHFNIKGDTESFNIYEEELLAGKPKLSSQQPVIVSNIRHKLTDKEQSFTATGEKLYFHWPIFKKFKETGYASIIRATLTLHQICSSKCHYCSTIRRNKADSISFEEAQNFIKSLYFDQAQFNKEQFKSYNDEYLKISGSDIRLKGVILSGGGQPNLWPYFEDFVHWMSDLDIEMGLITNGFPKKINEKIYEKFTWIRLSITPEDASPHYVDSQFNKQYIPELIKHNPKIKTGLSYVYGPWTSDDLLMRIQHALEDLGFDYCRFLTDCNLTRESQLIAHKNLAERLFKLGIIEEDGTPSKKVFHQLKYHGKRDEAEALWDEGYCYLQLYNVFWDTTGHEEQGFSSCYACDSITVLADESDSGVNISERKFNSDKWGTVKNTEIADLYSKPLKKYFDPREVCTSCLFMKNNNIVKELITRPNYENIDLSNQLEHVNFP